MLYFKLIDNRKAANLIKILSPFFLNSFLNKAKKSILKILFYIFLQKRNEYFLKCFTEYSERMKKQFQSSQHGKNFCI